MTKSGSQNNPARQPDGLSPNPYRWIILFGLVLATLMEVLDTTVVNVALPQMMGNLGATSDEIGWVSTGYILSNVVILPMTAWLSHRFGRRNYLVFSIALFIVSSFFCGMSRSLSQLVFCRICQGAGGAALLATAQATVMEIFPQEVMGTVTAVFGIGMIAGPTVAPALGGYITDNFSWPWVFFINIPIGLVSLYVVSSFLQNSTYERNTDVVDWLGIALLAVGLGSTQYVLEEGLRWDWFNDANIARLTVLAIVCLTSFVSWELSPKNNHPVVDLRVLKNHNLRAGVVLGVLLGFGLYGGTFVYPLFVQQILNFNAISTGLTMLPGGIASTIAMQICGRLINSTTRATDPRLILGFGVTMFVLAMFILSQSTSQSGYMDAQFALLIRGAGMGCLFMTLNVTVFRTLQGRDIAQASSILNLSRQLGGSFGIAVLNTYVVHMQAQHRSVLVENISSSNGIALTRIHDYAGMFLSHGFSMQAAKDGAYTLINSAINIQSATMAYDNAFLLIGLCMLLAAPTILMLKPNLALASKNGKR